MTLPNGVKKYGLVDDKNKVSHRALTEIVASVVNVGGGNLDAITLSPSTMRRHRDRTRKQIADELGTTEDSVNEGSIQASFFHWDGKFLKALEHAKEKRKYSGSDH